MIADSVILKDGKHYQKGDEIWDLGSWVATEKYGSVRHYKGLAADIPKLPHYAGTGSTAECLDTGDIFKYEKSTDKWYLSAAGGGGAGSGKDGFSPIATVEKKGNTATITITDRYGTTTAQVHDGSGAGYEFVQDTPQKTWTITHGLDIRYPSVTCIDGDGNRIYGDIEYYSNNVTIIKFNSAVSGRAILK